MPKDNNEAAALLDLAEYARELSDTVSGATSKQAMLGIAALCETLAFRFPEAVAGNTEKDD